MEWGSRGLAQPVRRPGPPRPLTTTCARDDEPTREGGPSARRAARWDVGRGCAEAVVRGVRVDDGARQVPGRGRSGRRRGRVCAAGIDVVCRATAVRDRGGATERPTDASACDRALAGSGAGRASRRAGSSRCRGSAHRAMLPSRAPGGSGRRTRVAARGSLAMPAVALTGQCCPAVRRAVRGARGSRAMLAVALTGQCCPAVRRAVRAAGHPSRRTVEPRGRSDSAPPNRAPDRAHRPARGDRERGAPTRAECGGDRGCGDAQVSQPVRPPRCEETDAAHPLPRPHNGRAAHARTHSVASTMPMSRRPRACVAGAEWRPRTRIRRCRKRRRGGPRHDFRATPAKLFSDPAAHLRCRPR